MTETFTQWVCGVTIGEGALLLLLLCVVGLAAFHTVMFFWRDW